MKTQTYIISSDFLCRYCKRECNSALRSSLKEAKNYIDDKVEEYRKSFSVAKEVKL